MVGRLQFLADERKPRSGMLLDLVRGGKTNASVRI